MLTFFLKATSIKLNLLHSYLGEFKNGLFRPMSKTQEVAIESMENYRGYVNFAAIRRSVRLRKLFIGKKRLRVRPPEEKEKKRLEIERLIPKINLVREVLHKANYHETYVWRSEEFLNSIEEQVRRWGNLSPKQKLALNKMYKRFLKKSEKKT